MLRFARNWRQFKPGDPVPATYAPGYVDALCRQPGLIEEATHGEAKPTEGMAAATGGKGMDAPPRHKAVRKARERK